MSSDYLNYVKVISRKDDILVSPSENASSPQCLHGRYQLALILSVSQKPIPMLDAS
jgi:hypothetical protein